MYTRLHLHAIHVSFITGLNRPLIKLYEGKRFLIDILYVGCVSCLALFLTIKTRIIGCDSLTVDYQLFVYVYTLYVYEDMSGLLMM